MRLSYYAGLVIVLLFFSSCSKLINTNKVEKKVDLAGKNSNLALICPNYFIPEETIYLLDKKREKTLKISSIKINCKKDSSIKDKNNQHITIYQTIYYQVLKNKVKLDPNNSFIYLALVDETNEKIQSKVLFKIRKATPKKIKGKIYFKNNNIFKVKNKKNLTFYYGFQ